VAPQDPNSDAMEFEVFFRELGASRWVRIEKELKEPLRIWDTRTVPDGKYEARSRPATRPQPAGTALTGSRVSDPITVDTHRSGVRSTAPMSPARASECMSSPPTL